MIALHAWAARHNITAEAFNDLRLTLGTITVPLAQDDPGTGKSESWSQSAVRVKASRLGYEVYRNNVGCLQDKAGRWVRYGLANDSEALNKVFKSSDLVGYRSIIVQPQHVGAVLGQAIFWEMKEPSWQYSGDEREAAQFAFLSKAVSAGCEARFVSHPDQI